MRLVHLHQERPLVFVALEDEDVVVDVHEPLEHLLHEQQLHKNPKVGTEEDKYNVFGDVGEVHPVENGFDRPNLQEVAGPDLGEAAEELDGGHQPRAREVVVEVAQVNELEVGVEVDKTGVLEGRDQDEHPETEGSQFAADFFLDDRVFEVVFVLDGERDGVLALALLEKELVEAVGLGLAQTGCVTRPETLLDGAPLVDVVGEESGCLGHC